MIVLDIETSGLNPEKCGIHQVGAIDLETDEEFFEECRIDNDEEIQEEAMNVNGMTEEEFRDKNKQSQKEIFKNFFKWIGKRKIKNFICQNPQFDIGFLNIKSEKYGLEKPYPYRAFDLHTLGQAVYYKKYGKFLTEEGKSGMGLSKILEMTGRKDERIQLKGGKIIKKGKPHNAIEDARLEAECFKKLLEELNAGENKK